ncbi:MAG: hypothetical protein RR536_01045 [Anaerovoracaceae bacterium]
MENITIKFVSRDFEYGLTLIENISHNNKYISFEICDEVKDIKGNNIILFDIDMEHMDGVMRLVENASEEDELSIYRYNSIPIFIGKLLTGYNILSGKKIISLNEKDTKLISFVSGSGGVGVSSVAMGTAKELKAFGEYDVLYISMEEIPSVQAFFSYEHGIKDIKHLLYNLINGKPHIYYDLFLGTDEVGVNGFKYNDGTNLLNKISSNEFSCFLRSLMSAVLFDYIIFDIGNNLSENSMEAIKISKKIVFIKEFMNKKKDIAHKEYINNRFDGEKKLDLIEIQNKVSVSDEIEYNSETIVYDPYSFDEVDGKSIIHLDKRFCLNIKKITEKLT